MPAPTLLSPGAILYLNSNIPPQPLQLNMGQRHNRKRTRSRPRNRRNNHARDSSVDSSFSFSSESSFLGQPSFPQFQRYTTFSNPPAARWHQQYSAWHVRQELQQQQQQQSVENQRLRMFGGEAADGADLCGPMLKVVMDLFDDIDYIDP